MPATNLITDKDNLDFIIAGDRGWGIMKTEDGGKNWYYPEFDIKPETIEAINRSFDINPRNRQEGWLAGTNYLYKTTDGGNNWIHTTQITGESIKTVFYHPDKEGIIIAGCSGANYYISSDNGETWINNGSKVPSNARFAKSNDSLFYFVGTKQLAENSYDWFIDKSTDFGKTFEECKEGLLFDSESKTYVDITDVQVDPNNPDRVYCGQMAIYKSSGALSKSTDGGKNWFRIDTTLKQFDSALSVNCIYVDVKKADRIYVGLSSHGTPFTDSFTHGGLYLTEDDCRTWRKLYSGEVKEIYSDEGNPANIYFSTNYGAMRFLDTLTVTGIEENKQQLQQSFQLLQNYPNPFNPSTTIKFTVPVVGAYSNTPVRLVIYDILGREINTLVDENKVAGEYSVNWDGKDKTGNEVSSGIYFYNIKFGDNSITKKMVLVR